MAHEASITIPGHVLSESLNEETVLLDMSSGQYFGLSPVASRLWQLLGQGVSLEQAQATLLDEFEVAPEVLRADVEELMAQLASKKLIERKAS